MAIDVRTGLEQGQQPLLPVPPAPFPYLWFSGRVVPWEQATVHVTVAGWPAIGAVFEGIRAYWNDERGTLAVFRLPEHMRRLENSMKLMRMAHRFSGEEVGAAVLEICRLNEAKGDIYIQPLAFSAGPSSGGRAAMDQQPEVMITVRPSPSEMLSGRALTAGVGSWRRISDEMLPQRIKALPNYANSRLASNEASRHGYDQPIFLNTQGKVAESSGSCLCLVRDGVLVTPPITASILESITRESVMTLARDVLGVAVQERDVDRTELYTADEIFLCGTAMEVAPVIEVDGFPIGDGRPGPTTTSLEALYDNVVRGKEPRYSQWLSQV